MLSVWSADTVKPLGGLWFVFWFRWSGVEKGSLISDQGIQGVGVACGLSSFPD